MELYIIRHAIAELRSPELQEEERRLTDKGRKRFELVVSALQTMGIRLDRILSSPWVRAAQTAEYLAPLCSGPVELTDHMVGSPTHELLDLLEGEDESERVAVVGHNPWVSELMAWLVFDSPDYADDLAFKKGGIAWLKGPPRPGCMELKGFWSPRVLWHIGGKTS